MWVVTPRYYETWRRRADVTARLFKDRFALLRVLVALRRKHPGASRAQCFVALCACNGRPVKKKGGGGGKILLLYTRIGLAEFCCSVGWGSLYLRCLWHRRDGGEVDAHLTDSAFLRDAENVCELIDAQRYISMFTGPMRFKKKPRPSEVRAAAEKKDARRRGYWRKRNNDKRRPWRKRPVRSPGKRPLFELGLGAHGGTDGGGADDEGAGGGGGESDLDVLLEDEVHADLVEILSDEEHPGEVARVRGGARGPSLVEVRSRLFAPPRADYGGLHVFFYSI